MSHELTLTQNENESTSEFITRIKNMQDELIDYMGASYTHAVTSIVQGASVIQFDVNID